MSEEDTENLTYHDRCRLLNSNPVFVTRHFQYRLEIVADGSLGRTKYLHYAICVEFQVCGSPNANCFLWVANDLNSTSKNKEEYVGFLDQIVHAFLPNRDENPELHNWVTLYQHHRHSRTYGKYKNEKNIKKKYFIKYKFANFFSKKKKQ